MPNKFVIFKAVQAVLNLLALVLLPLVILMKRRFSVSTVKYIKSALSWFVVCLSIISGLASQAATMPNQYRAELIKVIDADTIKLRLELYPKLYQEVNVRISGIDSPESRRGKKNGQQIHECEIALGKKARAFALKTLTQNVALVVKNIDPAKTKYAGRINGELWFDDKNYGLYLIKQGYAVEYFGGKRDIWPCHTN